MILKRAFDFLASSLGLLVVSPVLLVVALMIWLQDRQSPFYISPRAARGGGTFGMIKIRSMVVDADKIGFTSATTGDQRITGVGRMVRTYKLDELMQLWNVFLGDMSLVGPRPQVMSCVALYTEEEKRMLLVRPGITDPASIVFSDQGEVLEGSVNPDFDYNRIIRPWKSRLALAYMDNRSFCIDLWLIILTVCAIFSRPMALRALGDLLRRWKVDPLVIRMAARQEPLLPYPPPGSELGG
jgi:lipopolysaccharide/colanic/teichoic acid biosynthesis glycosyltransferase